ncbi:MAG TPA: hypothetical protein VKW77_03960 [Acidimicrobiales bacterium]|nr:hypothetical protein [Acidimicrobiales bacterium]
MELAIATARRGGASAWAYALRREGGGAPGAEEAGTGPGVAALALGLERAARDGAGEDVVVRASSSGFRGLLEGAGGGASREIRAWAARAAEAAARLASVRILPAPAGDLGDLRSRAEALLPAAAAVAPASRLQAGERNRA